MHSGQLLQKEGELKSQDSFLWLKRELLPEQKMYFNYCIFTLVNDYKRRGIEKVSTLNWKLVHNGVWGSENIDALDSKCSAKISPTTICRWVIFNEGPFNNYVDKMRRGGGQKMSVFVHAQGIKTVNARGGVKKWQNSVHVVVECPPTY